MQELKQRTRMQILSPPNPFLQFNNTLVDNNRNGTGDKWDEARQMNSEIEFQTRSDDCIIHSPSLWAQRASKDEAHLHHPSPRSRLQAIMDAQRTLMEMIQNMPDSSLELSLKDIVLDNQQGHQEVGVEDKAKAKIKGKCRNFKHGKISRSESMDSGVFLLKMFVPISLYSKRKSKTKSCSKISPNPPSKESEKPAPKDWWKMIYLYIKQNAHSRSIKRSLSSISIKESMSRSNETRLVESSSLLDESSFDDSKRYTSRSQRGCLF